MLSIGGSVERYEGDEFFKLGRMRRFQHFFHAGRLELEDGGGVRIAEDLVGSLVVKRNLADIDDIAGGVFDVVLRHFDNGQVAQAKKSNFTKPTSSTSPLSYMDTGEADSSA